MTVTRRRLTIKGAVFLLIVPGAFAATVFATSAKGLGRLALWPVVRACVADFKLTGAPFPCLKVDLSSDEDRGYVVLGPPLLDELIVAPTREIVGIEDPFLQLAGAPNYFNAAWHARSFLRGTKGREPERDEIALVVNSAVVRTQDQLHVHVGCLRTYPKLMLAAAAPSVPIGKWARIANVVPHVTFWATRLQGTDLSDIKPFSVVAEAFGDKVGYRGDLTIAAAGVRVEGDDQFLILASYAEVTRAWLPVRSSDLLDENCPAGPSPSE
jgi:CDP-diacylglycerol pyrophosphatase